LDKYYHISTDIKKQLLIRSPKKSGRREYFSKMERRMSERWEFMIRDKQFVGKAGSGQYLKRKRFAAEASLW
jgi:hypothetical protein